MYHLDNNSGVATRPDIPTVLSTQPRWFTEGGNGTSPSYPGAHWFNIVQGELLGVLSAAGITPQKHQLNQVTQAIQNLIRQGVSGKAEASHTHGIAQITGLSDALNGLSQKAGEAKTAADNAQAFANQKATELDNKKTDKLLEQTLDLTSLDPDKWYPVVLKMVDVRKLYRFAVRRALGDGNNPTWATHGAGFSTCCEWETQPSQWGAYPYIDSMRLIRQFTFAYCHQSPMLKIGQIYQASWEYIYLRGGTSYTLSHETDVIVDIGVSGYTWQHSPYSANLPIIESYDESLVPKTTRQTLDGFIGGDSYIKRGGDKHDIKLSWDDRALNLTVDATNLGNITLHNDFAYQKIGNFEVRKYPDGTMIQTYRFTPSGERTGAAHKEFSFNWAVAFTEKPKIFPQHINLEPNGFGALDTWINISDARTTNSKVAFWVLENYHNGDRIAFDFMAIGRWK